ncbi:MAG: sigma-70 family RNA polymerase sigma factor [Eubacteriales bacterium]|jgi:RNA polymerase sporulation-specific sigma factor
MAVQQFQDNQTLLQAIREGDEQARERLIQQNAPLVWSMVRRFHGRAEGEDLFQIGCIGLLKAAERFDEGYGVQFSTYAVPMILGEIRRFLRDDGLVKVSRKLKGSAARLMRAQRELEARWGREPTLSEAAAEAEMSVEEAVEALEATAPCESLSGAGQEGMWTVEERLAAPGGEGDWVEKMALRQVLDHLSPEEQILIRQRYFGGQTQSQVARILQVSQVQISRMERRLLKKLRQQLE